MKFLLLFPVILLSSCMTVPIPPAGENAGKYGAIDVRISYRPNYETILDTIRKKPTEKDK